MKSYEELQTENILLCTKAELNLWKEKAIKAEAGRAGFVAGYEAGHTYRFANIGDDLADEYAERVKAGE